MNPGTIGVLSLELARYTSFSASLASIEKPEGTKVQWPTGKRRANPNGSPATDIINKQNELIESFKGDWLWLLGDDHEFGDDALMKLLAHDVDIVCPVNVMRAQHFGPLIYDEKGTQLDWDRLDKKDGLTPIASCGNAGMLVKRHVFEKIGFPWFEWAPEGSPYHGSDLAFFWKARQAGFRVYIDTDTSFGHTTVATFTPVRMDGGKFAVMMTVQGKMVALFRLSPGQGIALFEQKGLEP